MTQASEEKMTVEKLLDFYKAILDSLGMCADEDGLISNNFAGELIPSSVGDKRLVLPTQEILRTANWDNVVAFHPLSEKAHRGESEIIKKLKTQINFRLTTVINCLMTELAEIAANKDLHDGLKHKQTDVLAIMPKADAGTLNDFTSVLNSVSTGPGGNKLISVYLKRGGKFKSQEYSRVAVTSFPIMDEFENDKQIFGVKVSVKNFKYIKELFNYILPEADDINKYSFGSRSMEAPYFHCLMMAFANVAEQLNKTTWQFRKYLDNSDFLHINLSWKKDMAELSKFVDLIPSLAGNDGEPSIIEKQKNEKLAQMSEKPQASLGQFGVTQNQPVTQPTATTERVVNGEKLVVWDEVLRAQQTTNPYIANQPIPGPPPGFAGTPEVSPWNQPQYGNQFQRGGYQQPPVHGFNRGGGYGRSGGGGYGRGGFGRGI